MPISERTGPQAQGRPAESRVHYAWVVLGTMTLLLLVASGARGAFGLFIKPLENEFGWGRTALSTVAAVSLFLYGAMGPVVGRLADRWGPRSALAAAVAVVGVGTMASAFVSTLWQLYLTAGVITAIGAGGTAMSVTASLVSRWFDRHRGLALGIAGGGMAAGQLVIIPTLMAITLSMGWRAGYIAIGAALLLLMLPLTLALVRNDPTDLGLRPYGGQATTLADRQAGDAKDRTGIIEAAKTWPFWMLIGSFWVCGYTTTGLVLTHLIPYATEHGFHAGHAAQALGVMGALNIVGTIGSGWLCDRFGQRGPLAGYYLFRGISLLFLPLIGTLPGLFAFAALFGLNYISTVPATTSLAANLYGRYSVGEIFGWIFFSHQIGAAVGSTVGGYLYDRFGNYTLAFQSAAVLAFAATIMVLAIRERPAAGRAGPFPRSIPATAPGA
jgi:MFS family permease